MQDIESAVERVMTLTGENDEELVTQLLEDAEAWALAYTNRTVLPPVLEKIVRDLAVISLNRMGTEGESSRSEGGESYSFDSAPAQVYDILNRYRLASIGGKNFESKDEEESS